MHVHVHCPQYLRMTKALLQGLYSNFQFTVLNTYYLYAYTRPGTCSYHIIGTAVHAGGREGNFPSKSVNFSQRLDEFSVLWTLMHHV